MSENLTPCQACGKGQASVIVSMMITVITRDQTVTYPRQIIICPTCQRSFTETIHQPDQLARSLAPVEVG